MSTPEHAHEGGHGGHKGGAGPLTRKVGGQPAWVWIAGVVVLAVIVAWWRNRQAQAAAAAQPTADPSADPLNNNTDPATRGSGSLPASPGTPSAVTPGPMSTSEWLAAAMKAGAGHGEDPIHMLRALTAFLNGGDLTWADQQVVNAAVAAIGVPPGYETISPGVWAPPPPKPKPPTPPKPKPPAPKPKPPNIGNGKPGKPNTQPTPAKPGQHPLHPQQPKPKPTPHPPPKSGPAPRHYTVTAGDSLSKIAVRFYHNGNNWPRIYAANKGVIGPNPNNIRPGQVLVIPA